VNCTLINFSTALKAEGSTGGTPPTMPAMELYMPFEQGCPTGTTPDMSGNGHTGTVYGATCNETGSHDGTGYFDFDGSDDYIYLGTSLPTFDQMSVSVWFKADGYVNGWAPIMYRLNGHSLYPRLMARDTNRVTWQYRINGVTRTISSPEGYIQTGKWYHLVGTVDEVSGGGVLYIDGVPVNSDSATGNLDSGSNSALIGRDTNLATFLDGSIDDVRIYNTALTQEQIQYLYAGTPPAPLSNHLYKNIVVKGNNVGYEFTAVESSLLQDILFEQPDFELAATDSSITGDNIEFRNAYGSILYDALGLTTHSVGPVNMEISDNLIRVESDQIGDFNETAHLKFVDPTLGEGLDLDQAFAVRDGLPCVGYCSPLQKQGTNYSYTVSQFTNYSVGAPEVVPTCLNLNEYDGNFTFLINEDTVLCRDTYSITGLDADQPKFNFSTETNIPPLDVGDPNDGIVTLDCNGSTIISDNNGVFSFSNLSNVSVVNCTLVDFATALEAEGIVGTAPPTMPPMVLYMPFEQGNCPSPGTTPDMSGTGNDGTVTGATCDTSGSHDNSGHFYFDGNSDYIVIQDHPTLDAGMTNGFSISLWYELDGDSGTSDFLFGKWYASSGEASYDCRFLMGSIDNDLECSIYSSDGSSRTDLKDIVGYSAGWHHFVFFYNTTHLGAYHDGILAKAIPYTGGVHDSTENLHIGRMRMDGTSNDFRGSMDDIRIYHAALSEDQIQYLYDGTAPVSTIPVSNHLYRNIVVKGNNAGYDFTLVQSSLMQDILFEQPDFELTATGNSGFTGSNIEFRNTDGSILYDSLGLTTHSVGPVNMEISDNLIRVESDQIGDFNATAHLKFVDPTLGGGLDPDQAFAVRDGLPCSGYCSPLQKQGTNYSYTVSQFTNYSVGAPVIDDQPPTVQVLGVPADWQNTTASISFTCADENPGDTGCANNFYYNLVNYGETCDPNVGTLYSLGEIIPVSAHQIICYNVTDDGGNSAVNLSIEIMVDKIPPTATLQFPEDGKWVGLAGMPLIVSLVGVDDEGGSGIDQVLTGWTGEWTGDPATYTKAFTDEQDTIEEYTVSDHAGNEIGGSFNVKIDLTPPETTTDYDPPEKGWEPAHLTVPLTATDLGGSGVEETYYCVDDTNTCTPTESVSESGHPDTLFEGNNYIRYYSVDNATNEELVNVTAVNVDLTPPSLVFDTEQLYEFDGDGQLTLIWSEEYQDGLSGIDRYEVFRNGVSYENTSGVTLQESGLSDATLYEYYVVAYDLAGNTNTSGIASTTIDLSPPSVPVMVQLPYYTNKSVFDLHLQSVYVHWLESIDPNYDVGLGSGVDYYTLYRNGSDISDPLQVLFYIDEAVVEGGSYSYNASATDNAIPPHESLSEKTTTIIDTIAPETNHSIAGTPGDNGWYKETAVYVDFSATDETSGVQAGFPRHGLTPTPTETGTLYLSDGIHTVYYYSQDNAGNVEITNSVEIKVDTTPPTVAHVSPENGHDTYDRTSINLVCNATDINGLQELYLYSNLTGSWEYVNRSVSGLSAEETFTITDLSLGTYQWYCGANDTAGNTQQTTPWIVNVLNNIPEVDNVVLSSTYGTNTTDENLTVTYDTFDSDAEPVKGIINWKVGDYIIQNSIMDLNMPFEGNNGNEATQALDYSGKNNHGTVFNATWNATGGHDGFGAYEFSGGETESGGTDDYISLSSEIAPYVFSAMSISGWFKSDDPNSIDPQNVFSNHKTLPGGEGPGASIRFAVTLQAGELRAGFDMNGVSWVGNKSGALTDSNWHHFVYTFDGDLTGRLYIDGVEQFGTSNPSTTTGFPGASIGKSSGSSYYFDGMIDDIQVYNRELSEEQAIALNNSRTDLIVSQETTYFDVWQACITPNDRIEDGLENCSNTLTIEWEAACLNLSEYDDDLTLLVNEDVVLCRDTYSISGLGADQPKIEFSEELTNIE
jgi:hypothetical protein